MSTKNQSTPSMLQQYFEQMHESSKRSKSNARKSSKIYQGQSADDFIRAFQASVIESLPKETQQNLLRARRVLGEG